ncbi:carcinoembryonic antigen-related cell adhesion molecule 5 [Anoplopoma fimbria]|uniref:carcinoembryonic antigen-related cell adhesion molecule 5 n=1 Tax=Anoplopoma fimbria TaxID=229290 RepID=UPI0023EAF31D|nr:carcinoembryonic antigen-related cell adhesion molecule 5 [Anoplopoma fimbria]
MDLFAFKTLLFLLSLIGSCVGETLLPKGPLEAILGKSVTIKTLVEHPEFDFITWNFSDGTQQINVVTLSKAGLKVADAYKGRATANTTNGHLTITDLKATDSGDFSINIISLAGTKTAEIKLKVLEPVSGVAIKSNLPEAIEHNSTVVLTCSAKGSFLKFTWLKGATPIVADGKRVTLKTEELSSTLTFTGVLRTDLVGPIYCTAANNLETEKSGPFNLTVHYGPEGVTISPASPPKVIRSDSNFSLSCSAVSSPSASFTWYHNQEQMEFGGPSLHLKTILVHKFGSQVGDYTCMAKNEKTLRTVPSAAVSFAVMDAISGAKVSGPSATLIAGNSTANISCMAMGGTVDTITWMKDGKPLSASSRLVFSANMTSVMINLLQKEDNGEFTCQLTNPVNSVKASYKMVVNYGPEQVMVAGEKAVEVNDKVDLKCSAASVPPANYTWKFNGTMTDVKTAQYLIEKAVYKNTGTYTCEAHNAVTGKTSMYSHTMSVKEEGALDDGLSDGAIAGIVIAVLIALGAAIALIVYCRQKVPVESPY